jgi:demethylmenaquinone methyltransferase / 2-methoxy-6-polyprenyl-1,4-benzoquinol methylase
VLERLLETLSYEAPDRGGQTVASTAPTSTPTSASWSRTGPEPLHPVGDAQALPFPDDSFDLVTIAFGLRNVTDKDAALREMLRVLRVGGQARVLEFSQVRAGWFRPLYDFHSFQVLPRLGRLFAGDADSYRYLAESIRRHPPQAQLQAMMERAGFERCSHRDLNGGIVAIHAGYKV